MTQEATPKHYAHYLGMSQYFTLNEACRTIWDAFRGKDHVGCYLVGSVLKRPDWRDVDVCLIMKDSAFDSMFKTTDNRLLSPLAILNAAMSEWLHCRTGLPVDFQFQRMTEANAKFPTREGHTRNAIGIAMTLHGEVA